jgi:hypothetical protein
MYWNTPLRFVMATMTLMPVSRPSVLKSMPLTVVYWFSTPSITIRPASSFDAMARLARSEMMAA